MRKKDPRDRCEVCCYFDHALEKIARTDWGWCRKNPPKASSDGEAIWPRLKTKAWCGKYKYDDDMAQER